MLEENLKTYRTERKAFIVGLKHYFNIDFYKIDVQERTQWLGAYLLNKREFFKHLEEHWDEHNEIFYQKKRNYKCQIEKKMKQL